MLKVECESCKAPYQVDERRVPPTGLKMRCPKCGHTFKVTNPNAPAPAAAAASAPAAPAGLPRPAPAAGLPAPIGGRRSPTITGGWNPSSGGAIPGLPDIGDDPLGELPSAKAGPVPNKFAPREQTKPPPFGSPDAGGGAGSGFGSIDDDLPLPAGDTGLPAFAGKRPGPGFGGGFAPGGFGKPQAQPGDFDFDDMPGADNPPSGFGALADLPSPAADLPATRSPSFGAPPFGSSPFAGGGPDLPAMRSPGADLPATRGSGADLPAPRSPSFGGFGGGGGGGFGEVDLPSVGGTLPALPSGNRDLPAATGNRDLPSPLDAAKMMPARSKEFSPFDDLPRAQSHDYQLPVVQSALPALQSSLPAVQGVLPSVQSSLPSLQSSLPSVQGSLPALQSSLPSVLDSLPSNQGSLPSPKNFDSFGEFELPGGADNGSIPPGLGGSGDDYRGGGGVGFGEVDLGGGDDDGAEIGTEEPIGGGHAASVGGMGAIGTEVALRGGLGDDKVQRRARTVVVRRGRSKWPRVIAGILALAVVGGAALEATSFGAFGRKIVSDRLSQKDYDRLLQTAGASARRRTNNDTWSEFRGAVDDLTAAHASSPRARALTAYAAAVAYEEELRYGQDGQSDAHAKGWIAELAGQASTTALVLANAAGAGVAGDLAAARSGLDAASKSDPQDAIQQDVALTRGEVELKGKDYAAALAAFKHAADLAPSARAQYGMARAYMASGDSKSARAAANAALTFNKQHAGALILRAQLEWREDHADDAALADLGSVLDGAGASNASPMEQSDGHASRGWVQLSREHAAEARKEFDEALKLNAQNVLALDGQGEVLLGDQRPTEAKARFDTAKGADPNDIEAITGDAKAKMALEDLQGAKQDLQTAWTKFPKSWRVVYTLGKAEEALGNRRDAETDYQKAIDLVDPKESQALTPYISLAEALAVEGKADQAQAKLEEAKAKLPDSATMQRAFGDVAAAQGKFDDAMARYQAALSKDPKDLRTHFRIAIAERKMGRPDDAAKEFDGIAIVDKEFPGLALERGLLFEETGHVDQALALFQSALDKAPNDEDLQLRVGAAMITIGNWKEGMPKVKKVLDARPNSAEANFFYGRGYMVQGKIEQPQAQRYLQKALDLDPNRAEYHLYIAWLANDSDPPALNTADVEVAKALALDASLADAYWQRGVLERKRTRIDDAMKDLRHALELKPSRFEAHATLAECFEEKNDDNSAMGEWQKAIAGDSTNGYWRYRYGKLRSVHGQGGAALDDLKFAVDQGSNMGTPPGWLPDAEYLAAEAMRSRGQSKDAIDMYNSFLNIAPQGSPDRAPAVKALQLLGAPYVQK